MKKKLDIYNCGDLTPNVIIKLDHGEWAYADNHCEYCQRYSNGQFIELSECNLDYYDLKCNPDHRICAVDNESSETQTKLKNSRSCEYCKYPDRAFLEGACPKKDSSFKLEERKKG